jgi:formylglycine-generating enzyme required for sulfatase activity
VNSADWYTAAAYCNWLSDQEGLPEAEWCYLPNAEGKYGPGMKLAHDYLKRIGYRLPNEAEWEYACRAGALTSCFHGESEELLGFYAWYTKNSFERGMLPGVPGQLEVPGDQLKPNDFGLFNMLGNAREWCQEPYGWYTSGEDKECKQEVLGTEKRVLRGGSFADQSWNIRCASRDAHLPELHSQNIGFRLVRTFR